MRGVASVVRYCLSSTAVARSSACGARERPRAACRSSATPWSRSWPRNIGGHAGTYLVHPPFHSVSSFVASSDQSVPPCPCTCSSCTQQCTLYNPVHVFCPATPHGTISRRCGDPEHRCSDAPSQPRRAADGAPPSRVLNRAVPASALATVDHCQ